MTVNKMNRSHRMTYMVGLLALAVALGAMLVLAGGGNTQNHKKNVFQQSFHSTYAAAIKKGDRGCAVA
jgi:hypothetical protein